MSLKNNEKGRAPDSGTAGNGDLQSLLRKRKGSSLNKDDTGRVSGENAREQRTPVLLISFA